MKTDRLQKIRQKFPSTLDRLKDLEGILRIPDRKIKERPEPCKNCGDKN